MCISRIWWWDTCPSPVHIITLRCDVMPTPAHSSTKRWDWPLPYAPQHRDRLPTPNNNSSTRRRDGVSKPLCTTARGRETRFLGEVQHNMGQRERAPQPIALQHRCRD